MWGYMSIKLHTFHGFLACLYIRTYAAHCKPQNVITTERAWHGSHIKSQNQLFYIYCGYKRVMNYSALLGIWTRKPDTTAHLRKVTSAHYQERLCEGKQTGSVIYQCTSL